MEKFNCVWQDSNYQNVRNAKTHVPRFRIKSRQRFLKTINSVMFNFLWNGKDKIKRLALISEYKDGGLKMPHVESAIKTQRIICLKKCTENYYSPWKLILSRILKDHGDKLLLDCIYNVADLPKHLPRFYRECFETWATVNTRQMTSRDVIMDQILMMEQPTSAY